MATLRIRHKKFEPTKMQAIVDAKRLFIYTQHIVSNDKNFSPENDFENAMRREICSTARSIYTIAWSANRISTKPGETSGGLFRERLDKQCDSVRLCGDLLALIEIAWAQFHLAESRIIFWGNYVLSVEEKLVAWHKSDVERYRQMFG